MLDPNEKSGAVLNAAIRDLQERWAHIERIVEGLTLQQPSAKVPVVEISPDYTRMTVNTSKLPEYSNSYRESKEEPGSSIPFVHPDGTVSDTMELVFDGRGYIMRKINALPNEDDTRIP